MIASVRRAFPDTQKAMTLAAPILQLRAPGNGEKFMLFMHRPLTVLRDAVLDGAAQIETINSNRKPSA